MTNADETMTGRTLRRLEEEWTRPYREELERLREAALDVEKTAEWYVQCLVDMGCHRPVRGLGEAQSGYERAIGRLRQEFER